VNARARPHAGRVAIVTGANAGLRRRARAPLAADGADLVIGDLNGSNSRRMPAALAEGPRRARANLRRRSFTRGWREGTDRDGDEGVSAGSTSW